MVRETVLSGFSVLVVEDDYYLAADVSRILRMAGADVRGPCATETCARDELQRSPPSAVALDINLGDGPSFSFADHLRARKIPFLFTTGYDQDVVPEQFAAVQRVEKPVQRRQIVDALSKILKISA